MAKNLSRRDVLRGAAISAAGLAAGPLAATASMGGGAPSPSPRAIPTAIKSRPAVGVIGTGGKGWSGMEWAAQHGDIVALCDVDLKERLRALEAYPRASSFLDYREMIDQIGKDLDAVIISTPDHHHYTAAALSMEAGIHCYCEKPLCRTVWETRQLSNLANKKKLMTQMGNQSTAHTAMRKIAAHIKKGTFGAVKEVHLWTDRAARYWKQGIPRPPQIRIPQQLDYDLWLGSRPYRPYGDGYHPFSWRGWWDFGTGALGDMGCHIFNSAHMALGLDNPVTVQAQTSGHNRDSYPTWAIVDYEFAGNRDRPGFKLRWYDGGKLPPLSLVPTAQNYNGNGVIFVCENGTIYSPNESNSEFHWVGGNTIPEIEVEESPGHMAEFFRAIEGGPEPVSNFPRYAGQLTETVLMGNLAIWADGPKLEWDAKRMIVKGTTEYDSLIRPEFRDGWEV